MGSGVLDVVDGALLKIGVVENVESFDPELQSQPFVQLEIPSHAHVDVTHARAAK